MEPVHLIAVGDFGAAVAERLMQARGRMALSVEGEGPWPASASAAWPRARLRILLAWRETPKLAETIDVRSADWGTPWLPVVLEHPRLRVGPVVVPGSGPCYRCFRERRAQHEQDSAITDALHAHYDATPAAGPAGFLPHHVGLAAALVEAELQRFDNGSLADNAGTVRHYHLLEHQASAAKVVAVHGCDRCRHTKPVSTWSQLADDLTALLPVLEEGR